MVEIPELRDYQKEAIEAFLKKGKKGIIQLPTGTGKTVIALAIWNILGQPKTLYIAPTKALIKDLMFKFENKYGIDINDLSDDIRNPALITFATYAMIRRNAHLAKDYDLYILDEVHHAGAKQFFQRALKPVILQQGKPILGLSASPKTSSEFNRQLLKELPILYKKTFVDKDMQIYRPPIVVYKVPIELSRQEYAIYDDIEFQMKECIVKSGNAFRNIVEASRAVNLYDNYVKSLAGKYLKLYNQRKQIVQKTKAKIEKAVEIIKQLKDKERIMVFAETIEGLCELIDKLNKEGIPSIAMTSKTVSKKDIEKINKEFGKKYKVLGLVKMGEEGIDFPDLDTLIIIGSSKSERQIIQRVGRVLRFKEGKTATIYLIYCEGTYEEDIVKEYIKKINPNDVIVYGEERETQPKPNKPTLFDTIKKLLKVFKVRK